MIIFSPALVASEAAAGVPLTHGRILYETHTLTALPSDVTASGDTVDGPKDAPLRPDTAEYWLPPSLPATWELYLQGLRDINAIGIAGHTLGTCGCSIEAESSVDNGANWDALALEHAPSDDAPIQFLDDERSANRIRLTVTGSGAVPRIAVVYVGRTMDLLRPIYGGHRPIVLSRDTELSAQVSRGGQFLGQTIRSMGVVGSIDLRNLTAAWYRSTFDKFAEAARVRPYFYAWRPQTFPLEVAYLWNTDDVSPSNSGKRDMMEVSMKVRGIGWVRNA